MNGKLTEQEENFVKDVLKIISKSYRLTQQVSSQLKMHVGEFDKLADSVFQKCQNGRVTIEQS